MILFTKDFIMFFFYRYQCLRQEQRGMPPAVPLPRERSESLRLRSRVPGRGWGQLPQARGLPAVLGKDNIKKHTPFG